MKTIIQDFWVLRHKADRRDNLTGTDIEILENGEQLKQHIGAYLP